MTISAPSIRFFDTVPIARPTRSERLRKGSILTSFGKDFWMDSIRVSTFSITSCAFAPFSIITTPPTASAVSTTKAPYLVALPNCTVAISLISTGTPESVFLTTIFSISSSDLTNPIPLIK